ncbi:flavin reductase family protein [Listeria rocourtiae]|uniref:flavin reductase family protein n=1 Tax=Listeria rocourtiae TaxID=647910 RepID=UPI003D2F90CE
MIRLDANVMSPQDNYKFLSGAIIPRPIAFVTTLTKNGVLNAAPFSFFNVVSSNPPIVSLAIQRENGLMKDTARNIVATGEMVIQLVDEDLTAEMNKTAARLAPEENELDATNLTTISSEKVSVPAIKEAKIRMEAKLFQHVPISNDTGDIVTDLILARVLLYHADETVFDEEKQYVLTDELKPVARLAGNNYAKLGESFIIERPK